VARLRAGQLFIFVDRFLGRKTKFPLFQSVQTNSGAHPTSCPFCTGFLFPGAKRPGREVDRLPLSDVEVHNEWSYICSSSVCIRSMDRDNNNFIFLFAVYNKRTLDGSQGTDVRDYKHCVQTVSGGGGVY